MRLSGEVFQKFRRARGLKLKDLTTTVQRLAALTQTATIKAFSYIELDRDFY